MTLDEAIKHAEEVAEEQEKLCKVNDSFNFSQPKWKECANEHQQLAEWLKDYKRLLEQASILDKIRAEIKMYEADCRLSVDEYLSCKQCTDNVFGSIYRIIDKYKAESEEVWVG